MSRVDPFRRLSDDDRALLRPAPLPAAVEPMKAVLTDERFSDPGWIYERKLDGIRCIAIKGGGEVRLLSRNALSLDARFPEVRAALAADPAEEFVVDGEVVAFVGAQTSFAALQQRDDGHGARPLLYLFDVLHLAGMDTTALPQRARKALLRDALRWRGPRAPDRPPQRGRRRPLPGGVPQGLGGAHRQARRRALPARALPRLAEAEVRRRPGDGGRRLDGAARQPDRPRGAADRRLRRRRASGTPARSAPASPRPPCATWRRGSRPCGATTSPFADAPRLRDATWVEPRLVAQVGFTEWTRDGRLRHPRFLGLREDKAPEEVVRE